MSNLKHHPNFFGGRLTLPETNIAAPENRPSQNETIIPTTNFQGRCFYNEKCPFSIGNTSSFIVGIFQCHSLVYEKNEPLRETHRYKKGILKKIAFFSQKGKEDCTLTNITSFRSKFLKSREDSLSSFWKFVVAFKEQVFEGWAVGLFCFREVCCSWKISLVFRSGCWKGSLFFTLKDVRKSCTACYT